MGDGAAARPPCSCRERNHLEMEIDTLRSLVGRLDASNESLSDRLGGVAVKVCVSCGAMAWPGEKRCARPVGPVKCNGFLRDATLDNQVLRAALDESVKLQSHQARLLNQYDGGERREFANGEEWIARLSECGRFAADQLQTDDSDETPTPWLALRLNDAPNQESKSTTEPGEAHPECSICRRRHGLEIIHECE